MNFNYNIQQVTEEYKVAFQTPQAVRVKREDKENIPEENIKKEIRRDTVVVSPKDEVMYFYLERLETIT